MPHTQRPRPPHQGPRPSSSTKRAPEARETPGQQTQKDGPPTPVGRAVHVPLPNEPRRKQEPAFPQKWKHASGTTHGLAWALKLKLDFELSVPAFPNTSPLFLFFPRVNLRTCLGEPCPVPASNRSEMTENDRRRRRKIRQLSEWAPRPVR